MNNAITKIAKRAKQIQNKNRSKPWKKCIAEASKEYRAGKLGKAGKARRSSTRSNVGRKRKNKKWRQTGTSNKSYDRQRSARPPGPRKPKGGKKVTYYERRKNRSDVPGSLTGTGGSSALNEMVLRNLRERNNNLLDGEQRLNRLQKAYKVTPKGTAKNMIKRQIKDAKKYISTIKSEIRILKTNIK